MEFYRGDNKPYALSFTYANGNPVDITGWKVYFTIKKSQLQSDDQADLTVDTTEHDDPENGKTTIHLTNGQTDNLEPGEYFYDFQVKKADGSIQTIVAGVIRVLADVTRRED